MNRKPRSRAYLVGAMSVLLIIAFAAPSWGDPVSTYFPTDGLLVENQDQFGRYIDNYIWWESFRRQQDLVTRSNSAYEHETHFPSFNGWESGFLGLVRSSHWDTDLPRGYLDWNTFGDTYPNRAIGASDGLTLHSQVWYWAWIRVQTGPLASQATRIRGQESDRVPDWCFDNTNCVYARDLADIVPYSAGWRAPGTYGWQYNQLYNESFEACTQSWNLLRPGSNWACYQGGAVEKSWFLEYNPGPNAWTSVFQDISFPELPGRDLFRAEIGVRCPVNQAPCPVTLALWGLGNGDESFNFKTVLPSDGQWWIMWTGLGGFARTHNTLRFEMYNEAQRNVDIDFATLHWTDTTP